MGNHQSATHLSGSLTLAIMFVRTSDCSPGCLDVAHSMENMGCLGGLLLLVLAEYFLRSRILTKSFENMSSDEDTELAELRTARAARMGAAGLTIVRTW